MIAKILCREEENKNYINIIIKNENQPIQKKHKSHKIRGKDLEI